MMMLRNLGRIGLILSWLIVLQPARTTWATAQTLVTSGVSSLVDNVPLAGDPTLLWTTAPECNSGPALTYGRVPRTVGMPGDEFSPALINRASLSIAAVRAIFEFNPSRPAAVCNPYQLLSNVFAFGNDLYFIDNQGPNGHAALRRLPRDANPSDAPQLLADVGTINGGQLLVYGNWVVAILGDDAGDHIVQYDRNTGALNNAHVEFPADRGTLSHLAYDGRFLYWTSRGALRRNDTTNGSLETVLNGPVDALYTYGYDELCDPDGCTQLSRIVYSQANSLYEGETISGQSFLLYSSRIDNARIFNIARDAVHYYFIEHRPVGTFGSEERFFRLGVGDDRPGLIYGPIDNGGVGFEGLRTDYTWLYFRDRSNDSLLRLANDEASIPVYDLRAKRLEVTQGLQDGFQSLRLIADKRTLVRFYVRSATLDDVGGVTAALVGSNNLGFLGVLQPVNTGSKLITVRQTPTRTNLDQSFQFELPRYWTDGGQLTLTAFVNPDGRIIEDTQANNSASLVVDFSPNPRLLVIYYNWAYDLGGTRYTPTDDAVAASRRLMKRLYPIGEPGDALASPGLHTMVLDMVDNSLTHQVDRTDADCVKRYMKTPADLNMCASDYVHARMAALRRGSDIAPDTVSYGNIAQAVAPMGKNYFTRGYANGQFASGPSGNNNYASHEVGHTLGRQHPFAGNLVCGHSATDTNYPYSASKIADISNANVETRFAGLDFGDTLPGRMTYLDADTQFDTMSYCVPNWISDYTVEGMYQYLISDTRPRAARAIARTAVLGDWLMVSGTMTPADDQGGFVLVQHSVSVMDDTPPVPGDFTLQLLNRAGGVVASYPFSGETIEERPGKFVFDLVVAFVPGTAELRAIENATGKVLATQAISANVPLVSDVQLVGAPNPVDGVVTVAWSASDPDGDQLRFDVFASRNGDPVYRPIHLGIRESSVQLDTAMLGGGSNKLRVVASDGANTAYADSATFTVPARPPKIVITSPLDGFHADWGQLVTLDAEVDDVQDELVSEVRWSGDKAGNLGVGRWVQADRLPVGDNILTVTATNSLGTSASASVTVHIGDVLVPPGPTLSVAPQALAWHIAGDDVTTQVASLTVDNHGSGALEFSVTSNQFWLRVDSANFISSSVAPHTFAVTAEAMTLPAGVTSRATLTFKNVADPNDVVMIPVEISRGNVFDHTGGEVVACNGDCDGSGSVTVDELVRAVNIALGTIPITECSAIDIDGNGEATIDEVLRAVNAALQGC